MKGQKVGYIRVSTVEQNTLRQDQSMESFNLDRIFTEKASAKSNDRPILQDCMKYLREGDIFHIHSIDRLARSLHGLQKIINSLVKKGVSIHFHKENLIFSGDDAPASKLMLQVMGAIAEFERSLIQERQREGIQAARKNGVRFGAPRKITSKQEMEIKEKIKSGIPKSVVAREYKVHPVNEYP